MRKPILVLLALCGFALADNLPNIDDMPIVPGFKWLGITTNAPTPGKAVLEQLDFAPYAGTALMHKILLPSNWVAGNKYPVIFEYLGNTGLVSKDMGMAYGLNTNGSGFIIVTLPFVNNQYRDTSIWWGNVSKTIAYAKAAIPWICKKWGGDTTKLVLAGFSRGAIATNYIGLHDDEIAKRWRAIISFAHYDDMSYKWDMTNAESKLAPERLKRLGTIPQLICSEYAQPVGKDSATSWKLQDSLSKYTSMDQAAIDFSLDFKFNSEGTKTFVQTNYPAGDVTYLGFPYMNHSPNYFMHNIPQRQVALDWLMAALQKNGPIVPVATQAPANSVTLVTVREVSATQNSLVVDHVGEGMSVQVFTLQGEKIFQSITGGSRVIVNGLAQGKYVVRISK